MKFATVWLEGTLAESLVVTTRDTLLRRDRGADTPLTRRLALHRTSISNLKRWRIPKYLFTVVENQVL